MVLVDKQTLIHWMLLDSLSKESHYREKISIFQNKYKTDFLTFQNQVENAKNESFEEWDDYIEWDAYEGFLIIRWDNAKHHRELSTFPHHRHEQNEDNVQENKEVALMDILKFILNRFFKS